MFVFSYQSNPNAQCLTQPISAELAVYLKSQPTYQLAIWKDSIHKNKQHVIRLLQLKSYLEVLDSNF